MAPLLLGLRGDAPTGRLRVAPIHPGLRDVRLDGVRLGERTLGVTVDGAGRVALDGPPDVTLERA